LAPYSKKLGKAFESLALHSAEICKAMANFFAAFEKAQMFYPTSKTSGFYL